MPKLKSELCHYYFPRAKTLRRKDLFIKKLGVFTALRELYYKKTEFLNFRHFRSFLILAHLS